MRFLHILSTRAPLQCEHPVLLITVITMARVISLQRLLISLDSAEYGCAQPDLLISIDAPVDASLKVAVDEVSWFATSFQWKHGRKTIRRSLTHQGLSYSWFSFSYFSTHDYLMILEDDMEVSSTFFLFFSKLHREGALSGANITGFCLHPNDWELPTQKLCGDGTHSKYLFQSPEPCNWGPIWKTGEWKKFIDWVISSKHQEELPYMQKELALNWNKYIDDGKDVQSSWVWRYNWLFSKLQVRYSMVRCGTRFSAEVFMAINHKEPGEHFKNKYNFQNDPALLHVSYGDVVKAFTASKNAFVPSLFEGYKPNLKSLRG